MTCRSTRGAAAVAALPVAANPIADIAATSTVLRRRDVLVSSAVAICASMELT
jgi:hypothetical protein